MSATMTLFALAIIAGIFYGAVLLRRPQGHLRAAAKIAPIVLLAVTAAEAEQSVLLVVALAFSALGDLFLAYRGERAFMSGLGAFLVAHLAYCALFAAGQDAAWSAGPLFLAGTVVVFAFALGMYRRLQPHLGAMRFPVAVYCGVIAAMAVAALSRGPDPVLLAGVALFMAADALLAFETFVFAEASAHRRWSAPAIWFAYLASQALIAWSFLSA